MSAQLQNMMPSSACKIARRKDTPRRGSWGSWGEMQVTWPLELPEVGGGEKLSSGINNKSHLRDRDTG